MVLSTLQSKLLFVYSGIQCAVGIHTVQRKECMSMTQKVKMCLFEVLFVCGQTILIALVQNASIHLHIKHASGAEFDF